MNNPIVCTLGMLVGDAFMFLPALRDIAVDRGPLRIVCGAYDRPVWDWAAKRVRGCNWQIMREVWNEDQVETTKRTRNWPNPWVPGYGYHILWKAHEYVQAEYPGEEVIAACGVDSSYKLDYAPLDIIGLTSQSADYLTVHPYTHHTWKNCGDAFAGVKFALPAKQIGYADQPMHWPHIAGFEAQADAVVESAGMAGVLSCWSNLAVLLHKPQIIASFTDDVANYRNPNARILIEPDVKALQAAIDEKGW